MNLIKICFWTCNMTSRSYFGKMNSTLGSVVPLAMFFLWSCFSLLLPASIAVIVCFQQTKILHPLHIINVFFWITWSEGLGSKNASLLKTKSSESCNRIHSLVEYSVQCTTLLLRSVWFGLGSLLSWSRVISQHQPSLCLTVPILCGTNLDYILCIILLKSHC